MKIEGRNAFNQLKKICPKECKTPEDVYEWLWNIELNGEQRRLLRTLERVYSDECHHTGETIWWSNWKDI